MKLLLFCLFFWTLPVMAGDFLPGTEDIPLMKGLSDVEETASFEEPSERMVLISAQTLLSREKVESFYKKTLANLGWVEIRPNEFQRGDDFFYLEISSQGQGSQIQFRLSQRNP